MRRFMRTVLPASISLWSSLFAQESPRIAVVGAGFSGLTAAYRLQQQGLDVQVYEARNRVGGRVFSVTIQENVAELGGQNIRDGGEATHLLALVDELGLNVEYRKRPIQFFYSEGDKLIDIREKIKERGFAAEQLEARLEKLKQNSSSMREVIDQLFDSQDILNKACSAFLSGYEGASVEKLSSVYISTLYYFLLGGISSAHKNTGEEGAFVEHVWLKEGNAKIASALAEKLGERVHTHYELKKISQTPSKTLLLSFANGEQVECDLLLLTIPCPVFKEIEIEEEVIPKERLQAIQAVEYGTNAKILTPATMKGPDVEGACTNGRVVLFLHGNGQVLNIYTLKETGYFTADTLKEEYNQDVELVKLRYTLKTQKEPSLAFDAQFASYDGPVAHSWPNDPYSRGSYSCIGVGQEESFTALETIAGEEVKTLFAPIGDTLFFAGEHTTNLLDVGGTMEAAVESGERMARLITKACTQVSVGSIPNSKTFSPSFSITNP